MSMFLLKWEWLMRSSFLLLFTANAFLKIREKQGQKKGCHLGQPFW
jgi:hypothetical protein